MGRLGERGFSIVSIVVAIAIASGLSIYLARAYAAGQKVFAQGRDKLIAEQYASELLEYFRAHTSDQLRARLATNPATPTQPPYKLCAHINVADRSNAAIVNPDPVANMTETQLKDVNRFYLVQVVDATTLQPVVAACGSSVSAHVFQPNERLYVSVGVSWLAPGDNNEVRRVVLTGLIP